MSKFTSPLKNLKVASPCSMDWDGMVGDDRKRYCGLCKMNVFNLSGMTKPEAEELLTNTEGRLCVRFYQRADGTVLTQDCPVGLAAIKKRVSRALTAVFSMLAGIFAGAGFYLAFGYEEKKIQTVGTLAERPTPYPTPGKAVMGESSVLGNVATMGAVPATIGKIAPANRK